MKVANLIICSYNREHFLERLLKKLLSIEKLSQYSLHFDTTVVLNNCTDSSLSVCKQYQEQIPGFYVYNEKNQGLSHARNKGLEVSNHDWCIYLDDDGLPNDDFFDQCLKVIELDLFDCFGGYYYPEFEKLPPKWLPQNFGSNKKDVNEISLLQTGFVSGGIMALRRSIFSKVQHFRVDLGVQGNLRLVGEETDLQNRMREVGLTIGFNPHWKMSHYTPKEKCSFYWNLKNTYLDSQSTCAINSISFSKISVLRNIIKRKYLISQNFKRWIKEPRFYWQNACLEYFSAILKQ